jgi:hypothetical protein
MWIAETIQHLNVWIVWVERRFLRFRRWVGEVRIFASLDCFEDS